MPDTIIENPILNSPFREPDRHWRFTDEGITNEIVETRRASAYFVPIPPPKKKGKQLQFDTEWTQDRIEPNDNVNRIRQRVKLWRERLLAPRPGPARPDRATRPGQDPDHQLPRLQDSQTHRNK